MKSDNINELLEKLVDNDSRINKKLERFSWLESIDGIYIWIFPIILLISIGVAFLISGLAAFIFLEIGTAICIVILLITSFRGVK